MKKTLIIAEVGVNHNGEFNKAKKLIKVAKNVGADVVKFQIFNSDDLTTKKNTNSKISKKNKI